MRQTTVGAKFWQTGSIGLLVVGVLLALAGSALAQEADVTFAKDVASILQEKCQACHRTGQMAPMSLTTYQEVRPCAGDPGEGGRGRHAAVAYGQDDRHPEVRQRHLPDGRRA